MESKNKKKAKVIILRGISGSHRKDYYEKNFKEGFYCSASQYYTDSNENYKYYKKGLETSHKFCQWALKSAMINKVPLIILDNSHIEEWELLVYIEMIEDYNYDFEVIRIEVDPKDAFKKSTRDISLDYFEKKSKKIFKYEGEKIIRKVNLLTLSKGA